jgi:hypothetical protein
MTGWNVDPGLWENTQGIATTGRDVADQALTTTTAAFERTRGIELTLPPRTTTVLMLKLKTPGTPYWSRPDLGISREDVSVQGREVRVKVHSLGSVPAPETVVAFRQAGRIVATAAVPALAAPVDLQAKMTEVVLTLPADANPAGGVVEIDPEHKTQEITVRNNLVQL